MSAETITIVGSAVGLLAVLVPLMLFLHGRVAGRIDAVDARLDVVHDRLATRIDAVHDRLATRIDAVHDRLTERIDDVAQRTALIEGALTGPYRPTGPEPEASEKAKATEEGHVSAPNGPRRRRSRRQRKAEANA